MYISLRLTLLSIATVSLLSACAYDSACAPVGRHGLTVNVLNNQSDEPINCGTEVFVSNEDYEEVLTPLIHDNEECDNSAKLQGLDNRPGVYDLIASKPGYEDYYQYDISIEETECEILPVSLTIFLVPLSD